MNFQHLFLTGLHWYSSNKEITLTIKIHRLHNSSVTTKQRKLISLSSSVIQFVRLTKSNKSKKKFQ